MDHPYGATVSDARETRFPGGRSQRVLRLDLLGKFTSHPSGEPPDRDAYILFHDRAVAMGWLTDAMGWGPTSLWAIHEAETEPGRCWFQVDITSDSSLLPLIPLCACAGAVIYRLGTFRLDAMELQLPAPKGAPATIPSELFSAAGWFGNCAASDRAGIDVKIGGVDVSVVANWMRPFVQDVFVCDDVTTATLRGTIVEWSLDALAWTAAFIAYGCHTTGVDVPLSMKLTPTP